MGSRGAGGFSAMILGSVSRYVATHAAVPVVVAREETMATHREIVVGVRDPAQSDAALGFGFEEAALRQARLLAVHAWSWSGPGHTEVPAEENSHLESAVTTWREKFPEVEARWEVIHGHPGRVLAGLSALAGLVVLGRHEPGEPRAFRGRVGHPRRAEPLSRSRDLRARRLARPRPPGLSLGTEHSRDGSGRTAWRRSQ